jgi:CRISPR type III-A-associated RAMP protein Csm4
MPSAFLVRFRPDGPWRIGPDSGARDQAGRIYHSDALFSAVSQAMARLGMLEEWLAATAGNPQGPAARFSSCFPCLEDLLFVVPPRTLWPPSASLKVRWKGARFVPLFLVAALLADVPLDEDQWTVDGPSQCLLPHEARFRSGPFRPALRSFAAVDRLTGTVQVHTKACLEFSPGAGWWAVVVFADEPARERWADPIQSALRLLADTGFGGERSLGWGHSAPPEFTDPPEGLLPSRDSEGAETAHWLLSLFTPAPDEAIDWQRGSYALVTRGGRIESPTRSGEPKQLLRMVEEGSVLISDGSLRGAAINVAPDGFPHPVFRAGYAVAIPIPLRAPEVRP